MEGGPIQEGKGTGQEILKGKVSHEMFVELRQTERHITEYMDKPVSITGLLSAWLGTAEEDTSPARIKLKQLVQTCESLVFVEEILTVRLGDVLVPFVLG
jgi:hypothetical protein